MSLSAVQLDRAVVEDNGAGDSLAGRLLVGHVLEGRPHAEAFRLGQRAARAARTEPHWHARRARGLVV